MIFIVILATIMVIMTIGTGMFLVYREYEANRGKLKKVLRFNLFSFIPLLISVLTILAPKVSYALSGGLAPQDSSGLGYIAAALSTGFAAIGAGYAVGAVGSSALGAVSEDPKILGKTLIFVGLAEGIAIYGLIVSILIIVRL